MESFNLISHKKIIQIEFLSLSEFVRLAVGKLHYLHFGVLVFIFTGVLSIIISLLTEPIPEEKVYLNYCHEIINQSFVSNFIKKG